MENLTRISLPNEFETLTLLMKAWTSIMIVAYWKISRELKTAPAIYSRKVEGEKASSGLCCPRKLWAVIYSWALLLLIASSMPWNFLACGNITPLSPFIITLLLLCAFVSALHISYRDTCIGFRAQSRMINSQNP